MTDNIKHSAPLKSLREGGLAIVTKGKHTGRFVKVIAESSYVNYKVIWRVKYNTKKHGDSPYPTFNEGMLMCVDNPFGEQVFNPKKF